MHTQYYIILSGVARLVPLGAWALLLRSDYSIRVMTALLGYIYLFSVDMVKLDGHMPTQAHP